MKIYEIFKSFKRRKTMEENEIIDNEIEITPEMKEELSNGKEEGEEENTIAFVNQARIGSFHL